MASSSQTDATAEELRTRGKRLAAAYIRAQCVRSMLESDRSHTLNEYLDMILDPSKAIDDWETTDWCKWLMAGGRTPEAFANIVRTYDSATTCGLVWTPNFVAYRCRTCSISPCMSLCTECFKRGNHHLHDFNMFLSQAGGACDCGDTSVLKEIGFCDRHGPKAAVNKTVAPADLMYVTERMMPRIFLRLIQHLRENYTMNGTGHRGAIQQADGYLTMLLDLNSMGALMRSAMTAALTDPEKYRSLVDPATLTGRPEYVTYCQNSYERYKDAVKTMPNPEPPDEYKECVSLQEHLEHTTFVEELMFWTVVYEFPQKLVCLLLNILPDPDYKEALTRAFVLHYSRISLMLERSGDPDNLSNRVVHVSVQLFSNERLAVKMVDQLKLLHVMVVSLKYMMGKILIQNTLHDPDKNFHYVVDCGRRVMTHHCYWPLVSDLNNVLSHQPVAIRFMSDDTLLEMWFNFLSMFQGMNVNQRALNRHIEFEPNTYYAAFSAELEASAYPMWALVSHLRGGGSVYLSRRVLTFCLSALQDWLDAVYFTDPNVMMLPGFQNDMFQVSFHLPLHRYFAVFLCQAVRQQGATLNDLLPPTDMLHLLMMHPLRVQVACYEILNGLWVRNGLQIKGQAMTYIQCNFCNSMVDADLYLLQVCATKLPPDEFLKTIVEKFQIRGWLSLCLYNAPQNEYSEAERNTAMLDSCLAYLATLVNVRTNLGLSDAEISRLEMVTLLCMGDKTHSQLMELMPERCGTTENRNFEAILSEVAQYRAPNLEASGNMQQGMYVPKSRVWDELFDPLHVLLRAVHRKDFQMSMDRYTEYVKQTGKLKNCATAWPPFRHPAPVSPDYDDPRIVLRTRVFHAMILIILHKAVNGHNISEHILALTIYLLEMAVVTAEVPDKSANPLNQYSSTGESSRVIKDMDLEGWFETDNLSENLRTVIPQVILVEESESSSRDSEFKWRIRGEIVEDPSPLMLNQALEEGSLEMLALPSVDTGSEDGGLSTTTNPPALPALPLTEAVHQITILPEEGIIALPDDSSEYDLIPVQGALPLSTEESMALALEPPPSPNNVVRGQPALPPPPQRPAVTSGTEIVEAPTMYQRLSTSSITTTEIVPSASTSHKHFQRRESQGVIMQPQSQFVKVDESIISLLLKLHSQLSGVPDSYNPAQCTAPENEASTSSAQPTNESRIGDGPFFIGQLLNKIASLDPMCKEAIVETRNKLWPRMQECEEREKERREREERRRKAKERQQKLMAEFANKQKQFMEKAMKSDKCGMDWEKEAGSSTRFSGKKMYDCVICNQTTRSTEHKPMGLVVLVQATSIIGHERQYPDRLVLPTSDHDPPIPNYDTRGVHFDQRLNEMTHHFDSFSWLLSVNLGWKGGVHVQTCGHHLHLDCLKSYLQALRSQQRQGLAVEKGEYLCPVCRQLANSVLPLAPQLGDRAAVVPSRHAPPTAMLSEIHTFLKERVKIPTSSNLAVAMGKAMEDIASCTYLKYKQKNCSPSRQSFFLFVTSVARTNFEIELIQRGGSLCVTPPTTVPLTPKRDCIVALLHILAAHVKTLAAWPAHDVWQQLSGITVQRSPLLALTPRELEVPLLLRDPTALLIQFILLLPLHLDRTYFSAVVKVVYRLLYYQVVVQLSCSLTPAERTTLMQKGSFSGSTPTTSETMLARIIDYFKYSHLYNNEHCTSNPSTSSSKSFAGPRPTRYSFTWHCVEQQIQTLCLPFLRVAALLRYHLYEEPLPLIDSAPNEFMELAYYLELVTGDMDCVQFNSAMVLDWPDEDSDVSVPRAWCDQFLAFIHRSWSAKSLILEQHISWHVPKLLSLPREYEKIFTYYHERQCPQCNSVPQEICICLLCGTVVCLKQNCCKNMNICEAVRHSIDCGGGTGIYLVVTSTYIIVIRGRRACLWGSLYLDDFQEEDKDLKRGKPLYLSEERYQLLEQQWLAHRFDHTKKTWVWHRDGL